MLRDSFSKCLSMSAEDEGTISQADRYFLKWFDYQIQWVIRSSQCKRSIVKRCMNPFKTSYMKKMRRHRELSETRGISFKLETLTQTLRSLWNSLALWETSTIVSSRETRGISYRQKTLTRACGLSDYCELLSSQLQCRPAREVLTCKEDSP